MGIKIPHNLFFILFQNIKLNMNFCFQAFVAVLSILAVASADQSSHQSVKHGNAPAVTTAVHKPHGSYHAKVVSQPSAQPNEVHQAYNEEKYVAAAHAPAHKPVHAPHGAAYAPAHPAPYHAPAPYHPAPVYKPAPAPYHPAPAPYHAPAPAYKPARAPYHAPAPAYKPAHPAPAYHEPAYDTPPVYQYGYAVADDYAGTNFAANENRDNYATTGEYRVALPDGRTQIVTYNVADAYSGYVADVRYEGEAHYDAYKPAPAYKPAHPHA